MLQDAEAGNMLEGLLLTAQQEEDAELQAVVETRLALWRSICQG